MFHEEGFGLDSSFISYEPVSSDGEGSVDAMSPVAINPIHSRESLCYTLSDYKSSNNLRLHDAKIFD